MSFSNWLISDRYLPIFLSERWVTCCSSELEKYLDEENKKKVSGEQWRIWLNGGRRYVVLLSSSQHMDRPRFSLKSFSILIHGVED